MNVCEIIDAWTDGGDGSEWADLDSVDKINFALVCVETAARAALEDLERAVYEPDKSSLSVHHACNHVRQVFSTGIGES
jgi:hypothetical protein